MNLPKRINRHCRLMWQAIHRSRPSFPPFLTLFVTSRCNLSCKHCFYWKNLNQEDDLHFDDIKRISNGLGVVENLNISGGEPFLRQDLSAICRLFVVNNHVKQIYITTNAYFTEAMHHHILSILKSRSLHQLVLEISLDGMHDYHNALRSNKRSFQKAFESYRMLAAISERDPRLRIHAVSTVSSENIIEVRKLSQYLYDRCPSIEHHGIAVIRGSWRKNNLKIPDIEAYRELFEFVEKVWERREKKRFGSIVAPMAQWAKYVTVKENRQVVSCLAGVLSAVIYANGDLGLCELQPPVGNIRNKGIHELWHSQEARALRADIKAKKCHCTHEISLWSSIAFQPFELIRAIKNAGIWKKML